MPLAQITTLAGATPEQKRRAIASVTAAIAESFDVAPAAVRVLIVEIPPSAWGVGGKALDDR